MNKEIETKLEEIKAIVKNTYPKTSIAYLMTIKSIETIKKYNKFKDTNNK